MLATFSSFEDEPRWLCWREEDRGGKPTKVPYCPTTGRHASATDPLTWATLLEAEGYCREHFDDAERAGIGISLGYVGNDRYLCGIDLDSSLDENGSLARWAADLLKILGTYAEVSPSGKGLKAFFFASTADIRPFLDRIGVEKSAWGCKRGIVGLSGADHGPGIELYTAARYFTVTGRLWSNDHQRIIHLEWTQLERLATLIPSTGGPQTNGHADGRPTSRSDRAFRSVYPILAPVLKQMRQTLRNSNDPEIQDWVSEKGELRDGRQIDRIWENFPKYFREIPPEEDETWTPIDRSELDLTFWLERDVPPPDFMLGELVSTSSRILLVAPTGIGKTNFVMAQTMAIAGGDPFLHWRAGEGPRKVLFIDGEMPKRLLKTRLQDAVRRRGGEPPDSFFILSRDDFPDDMPPLNTDKGQRFIEQIITTIGGVDLITFDNVQALLIGDMKDELPWQETLPWVRDLTRRNIGQIWVHHTGHDETHSYGTKTREWQLDTVMLLEKVEEPEADIIFTLSFIKSRERTPENRSDYEPTLIKLINDQWSSSCGIVQPSKRPQKDRALVLLRDALAREGAIPPANEHIPPYTPCVTEQTWRIYCERGSISEGDARSTARMAFTRAAKRLLDRGVIGKWGDWVWITRPSLDET